MFCIAKFNYFLEIEDPIGDAKPGCTLLMLHWNKFGLKYANMKLSITDFMW